MARIVFFGNERLATAVSTDTPTLRELHKAGHEILAVVSHYEKATSRKARQLEIAEAAKELGIPLLLPERPSDVSDQLRALKPEIGVLVAYGKIVPNSVINIFPHGIINIHPSSLPLHRGPTPIESVILNCESKTGVSIMQLVKEMDAGPIFGFSEVTLTGKETKQALADKLLSIGSKLIIELLPDIVSGEVVGIEQNNSEATYDKLIQKEDGNLDFQKPAVLLEREIRAYQGWPKSYTRLGNLDVIITKARVATEQEATNDNKELFTLHCGNGSLLIEELQPVGKKPMSGRDFLLGYSDRLQAS